MSRVPSCLSLMLYSLYHLLGIVMLSAEQPLHHLPFFHKKTPSALPEIRILFQLDYPATTYFHIESASAYGRNNMSTTQARLLLCL